MSSSIVITSAACGVVAGLTQHDAGDVGVLERRPQRQRAAHAEPGDDDLPGAARRGAGRPPRPRRSSRPSRSSSMSSTVVPWPGRRGSSTWKPGGGERLGEAAHRRRVAGEAVEHEGAGRRAVARVGCVCGTTARRRAGRLVRRSPWPTFYRTGGLTWQAARGRPRLDPPVKGVVDSPPMSAVADSAGRATGRRATIVATPSTVASASSSCIDAAAELFADNGYAATRIQDICKRAGVAKGLFYWYFPTKQELFAELVRIDAPAAAQGPGRGDGPRCRRARAAAPGQRGQRPLPDRARRLLLAARRRAAPTPATPRCCARAATSTAATSLALVRDAQAAGLIDAPRADRGARPRRARRRVVADPRVARGPHRPARRRARRASSAPGSSGRSAAPV